MTTLIIGLALFLGIHSVKIFALPLRTACAAKSPLGWKFIFSLISFAGLYFIVTGYAAARLDPVILYSPPIWTRHLVMLLMLPVFPLIVAAYLPTHIRARLKHPMLVATKLWALVHLIANGMLADIALFGGFFAWAVILRISIKRRPLQPSPTAGKALYDGIAIVLGLAIYVGFVLWGHQALIGMPLIPTK